MSKLFLTIFTLLIIAISLSACTSDRLPKPSSYLLLQYPKHSYKSIKNECNYEFEASEHAQINLLENCWMKIIYAPMKATLHITYRQVDSDLDEILKEVEKLTFKHTIKADAIDVQPYENLAKKVYGKIYNINGDTATNLLFSATDSTNHVVAGALYFNVEPNYDSILPAINYLRKDVRHLVETIQWKK